VERKAAYLADLVEQQRALRALMARNAASPVAPTGTQLELPFLLVQVCVIVWCRERAEPANSPTCSAQLHNKRGAFGAFLRVGF
jgi:hypothetical protein